MRDEVARLRKLGKRQDWPDDVRTSFNAAWYAVAAHIEAGHDDPMDVAAIHALFGWPAP